MSRSPNQPTNQPSAETKPTSSLCSRLAPLFSCFTHFPQNPHKTEGKVFYENVFILKNSIFFAKGFCFARPRILKWTMFY